MSNFAQALGIKNRMVTRSAPNPMDKSTIVSILPFSLNEEKCTIEPGKFEIPAAAKDDFQLLVVGTSSWWKDIDPDQPLLEIMVGSMSVAKSIVMDFCNSVIGCDMGEAMPGLFFIPGEHKRNDVSLKYKVDLEIARRKQNNWFLNLVKMADILWSRSNGNPLSIHTDMRLAAEMLGMKDKPWMGDIRHMELIACKACGTFGKPGFPICATCGHVIDQKLYDSLGLKKAV